MTSHPASAHLHQLMSLISLEFSSDKDFSHFALFPESPGNGCLLEPGTLVGNSTEHYRIVVSHQPCLIEC
jgi:hypothetical protein